MSGHLREAELKSRADLCQRERMAGKHEAVVRSPLSFRSVVRKSKSVTEEIKTVKLARKGAQARRAR